MRYTKVTKNSVNVITDEEGYKQNIVNAVGKLSNSGYICELIEGFTTAVKFFLDSNSQQERSMQIKEIMEALKG